MQARWGVEWRPRWGRSGEETGPCRWLFALSLFRSKEGKKRQRKRERERQVRLPCSLSPLFSPPPAFLIHSHLLEHDALGVRRPGERLLPLGAEVRLLVVLVGPELRAAVRLELAPGSETARLAAMEVMCFFFQRKFWRGERGVWVLSAPHCERSGRCGRAAVARRRGKKSAKCEAEGRRDARSTAARKKKKRRRPPIAISTSTRFFLLRFFFP